MSPRNFYQLSDKEPTDLQVCECWDDDVKEIVFGQWLDGQKKFFTAEVEWMDGVTAWRPVGHAALV